MRKLNLSADSFIPILIEYNTNGKLHAIKVAREKLKLPLISAKALVDMLEKIDGQISCPHCHQLITEQQILDEKRFKLTNC